MTRSIFKRESFFALLALTLLGASSTVAQIASSTTACTRHYVVKDGDTCDKIGQKTLTSTYQIESLNLPLAGKDCYTLEVGNQLCLGTYGNDCQLVHRATNTDDCTTIAAQYGITESLLRGNNPNMDCGQVYDGLMLCVVAGLVRPPADPSLNNSYVAEKNPGQANFVMPLGKAIVAHNAAEAGPHTVKVVTVQPSATPSTHAGSAKRHNHIDSRSGHGHHHQHHQAAAKRYQMSQDDSVIDSA